MICASSGPGSARCTWSAGASLPSELTRPQNRFRHAIIRDVPRLTRRKMLGASAATAGAAVLHNTIPHSHPWDSDAHAASGHGAHEGHSMQHAAFDGGSIANPFDPHEVLRDFD